MLNIGVFGFPQTSKRLFCLWLRDRCVTGPGFEATGLYSDYRRWCEGKEAKPTSALTWAHMMYEQFGLSEVRSSTSAYFKGGAAQNCPTAKYRLTSRVKRGETRANGPIWV